MQVTVLMPIYNAEKYVHDAINSLLAQTCGSWKLICIDDGSTDSSASIVEEYCKKDNRISLLRQENAGPAVARAKAIEIADTEYVSILDADDAYTPDYVKLMLRRAEETDADCIVPDVDFGYKSAQKRLKRFAQYRLPSDMIIENGIEAFSMTLPWQLHGWLMIKTSFAKQYYTIEQASYSSFNSDEYITRLLYLKSKRVALCQACYKYRMDENSITRLPSLKMFDYLITLDRLIDLCASEKVTMRTKVEIFNDFYVTIKRLHKLIRKLPKEDRNDAKFRLKKAYRKSYCRKMTFDIWKSAPLKTKIKFAISLVSLNSLLQE